MTERRTTPWSAGASAVTSSGGGWTPGIRAGFRSFRIALVRVRMTSMPRAEEAPGDRRERTDRKPDRNDRRHRAICSARAAACRVPRARRRCDAISSARAASCSSRGPIRKRWSRRSIAQNAARFSGRLSKGYLAVTVSTRSPGRSRCPGCGLPASARRRRAPAGGRHDANRG